MKVKCKICGQKGFFDDSKVTEFHASRFLFISKFTKNNIDSYLVCRNCVREILDSLEFEQYQINDLYEPEIKDKS